MDLRPIIVTVILLLMTVPSAAAGTYSLSPSSHWQNECGPQIDAQNNWDSDITNGFEPTDWKVPSHPNGITITNSTVYGGEIVYLNETALDKWDLFNAIVCNSIVNIFLDGNNFSFVAVPTTLGPITNGMIDGDSTDVISFWLESTTQYGDGAIGYGSLMFEIDPLMNAIEVDALIEIEGRIQWIWSSHNSQYINSRLHSPNSHSSLCSTLSNCFSELGLSSLSRYQNEWEYFSLPQPNNGTVDYSLLRIGIVDLGDHTGATQQSITRQSIEKMFVAPALWMRHIFNTTIEIRKITEHGQTMENNPIPMFDSQDVATCKNDNFNVDHIDSFEKDIANYYNFDLTQLAENVDLTVFIAKGGAFVHDDNGNPVQGCSTPAIITEDNEIQSLNKRTVNGRFIYVDATIGPYNHGLSYPLFENGVTILHEIGHSFGGGGHPFEDIENYRNYIEAFATGQNDCARESCLPRDAMENRADIDAFNPVFFFDDWIDRIEGGLYDPTNSDSISTAGIMMLKHTRHELDFVSNGVRWVPGGLVIESFYRDSFDFTSSQPIDYLLPNENDIVVLNLHTMNPSQLSNDLTMKIRLLPFFISAQYTSILEIKHGQLTQCEWTNNYCETEWFPFNIPLLMENGIDKWGCETSTSQYSTCMISLVIVFPQNDIEIGDSTTLIQSDLSSLNNQHLLVSFSVSGHNGTYLDGQQVFPNGIPFGVVTLT